jgi:dolichol-phosphate mannosyltransferase
MFYSIFSYLTGTKQDPSVANFGIYHKKVIDAVLNMGDYIRYFPTMVQWVGFKKYYLPVKHAERTQGTSSYNFKKLISLAVNTILAFSDKPLRLTVKIGFVITLLSFSISIVYFILYLVGIVYVLGFTSLILSLWFLAGVVISILGILGLYIGRIFENVKQRPTFIINEKLNI